MQSLLPLTFIVLAALSLVATLYFTWQSLREVFVIAAVGGGSSVPVARKQKALLAEKKTLLLALKELDAEREAGKLGEQDYAELQVRYRGRAREVLRMLDTELSSHREAARALLAKAAQGKSVASAAKRCKRCDAANDTDALYCKRCGAPLRDEAPA